MLTVAGGIKGRPGKYVGEAAQFQQGGQGFLPARLLSPEGGRFRAAVGEAQGVRRRHQLAEAAAADVLALDRAPDLAALRVVPPRPSYLPAHLCFPSKVCKVFKRPPPFADPSAERAFSLHF